MKQKYLVGLLFFSLFCNVFAQQNVVVTCPDCGHKISVIINTDGTAVAKHIEGDDSDSFIRCKAITAKGTQCLRQAQSGSDYCWQHAQKNNIEAAPKQSQTTTTVQTTNNGPRSNGQCKATTKAGKRCSRSATNNGYCWQHAK